MTVSTHTNLTNSFLSFFPPPAFLMMPAVGIDVSDTSIKFVEFSEKGGRVELARHGSHALPAGAVVDGKIENTQKLGEALHTLQRKCNFSFVRASLPEQQAYVFRVDVGEVKDEAHLKQMIEFKLEENVPLSPKEAVLGYDMLGPDGHTNKVGVAVTAYPRENVMRYLQAFQDAALMPLSFEIESHAIARSVIKRGDLSTTLIVDFGENRTGLAIVSRGLLAFTTTLDVRGYELTQAIKELCSADASEVARIKNEEGIRGDTSGGELEKRLMSVAKRLLEGVRKHHSYWDSRVSVGEGTQQVIQKVVLCGGNSNMAGLSEYLSANLKTQVGRANVWINAFSFDDVIPELPFEESLSYATAIGLALQGTK